MLKRSGSVALLGWLMALQSVAGEVNLATNGSFEDTGTRTSSFRLKDLNGSGQAYLPGWSITAYPNFPLDCLMYSGQTTALCNNLGGTTNSLNPGGAWQFYTYPGASPDGGNFLGVDGDPNYSAAINQTITGLTAGETYNVGFYQAAAQQAGFSGATTQKWKVTFGDSVQTSDVMNTPSEGTTAWNQQNLYFVATAATQTLSFLAQGSPSGDPPFVLLDGISVTEGTPEPSSMVLLLSGLTGVAVMARRRAK